MKWENESIKTLIKQNAEKDPIDIIREKARDLVIKAYDLGWNGPPFSPIKLADILGHTVLPNEGIIDARILQGNKKSFIIEYNPYQRDTRINFSIAHEIGHTFFEDCGDRIRNREEQKDPSNWEVEFLCDVAASEILLPYAEFSVEANSMPANINSLMEISSRYRASMESVFLRFCEVVDKPCTIIIASFSDSTQTSLVVNYSKSSRSSSLKIESGFILPKESKAYECVNSGWTSFGTEAWKEFGNVRYKVYSIGLSPIKKSPIGRVGIMIVPEFSKDETQGKLYMVYGDATKPRGDGPKIIGQIINTSGGLGFGFGRSMTNAYPESKKVIINWMRDKSLFFLGASKLTRLNIDTYVFHMVAQQGIFPKGGIIPLRYESLRKCLIELATIAKGLKASIHMPQIGAGQAKGDWNIIQGFIYNELIMNEIDVTIYVLPGNNLIKSNKSGNLTLFDES